MKKAISFDTAQKLYPDFEDRIEWGKQEQRIKCVDCGTGLTCRPWVDGWRCPLCAKKEHIAWLERLDARVRTGTPDGHTPAMSEEQRKELHHKIATLKAELKRDEAMTKGGVK